MSADWAPPTGAAQPADRGPQHLRTTPATAEELARHDDELRSDQRHERTLMWKEVIAIVVVAVIVIVRQRWLI